MYLTRSKPLTAAKERNLKQFENEEYLTKITAYMYIKNTRKHDYSKQLNLGMRTKNRRWTLQGLGTIVAFFNLEIHSRMSSIILKL